MHDPCGLSLSTVSQLLMVGGKNPFSRARRKASQVLRQVTSSLSARRIPMIATQSLKSRLNRNFSLATISIWRLLGNKMPRFGGLGSTVLGHAWCLRHLWNSNLQNWALADVAFKTDTFDYISTSSLQGSVR